MNIELLAGTKASDADVAEVKERFNPSSTANLHIDVTPYDKYSTTEHIVGEWIDGSTLYEKTCHFTYSSKTSALPSNASVKDMHGAGVASGNANGSGAWGVTLPYVNIADLKWAIEVDFVSGSINIAYGTSLKYADLYLTVRYTKS